MLTRARGGKNLDYVGETGHLLHLCSRCHKQAHEDDVDLLMSGQVMWDSLLQRPVYQGDDEYLSKKYGREDA